VKLTLLLFLSLFFRAGVHIYASEITYASSVSYNDVFEALENTQLGGTLIIPDGEADWSTSLTVPDSITILANNSIINLSLPIYAFTIGNHTRVSGLHINFNVDEATGIKAVGENWRVDHCTFTNNTTEILEGVRATGTEFHPSGLVDHCTFINSRVLVYGSQILMANKEWAETLHLGSKYAVYVEDCQFSWTFHGNVIDSNYGARYVFRYNQVTDSYIHCHSVQATNRASRSWEIYGNTIIQSKRSMWSPIFLRGGTGVVFDNTIKGHWSRPAIVFDNVRTFSDKGDGGLADGSSLWDGNEDSTGYPARDQIGRSTDQFLWTDFSLYPTQKLYPVQLWNNTFENEDMDVYIHNNCENHIQENRDYYIDDVIFDADNNTYRSDYVDNNNLKEWTYIPYTYPHPLSQDVNTSAENNSTKEIVRLLKNYPNPFNQSTTISFYIPIQLHQEDVSLTIHDIYGKEVRKLVHKEIDTGWHEVILNRDQLPNGIYIYHLQIGDIIEKNKMVLVK